MIDDYTRLLEVAAESGNAKAADHAVKKLIVHLKSIGQIRMLSKVAHELKKVQARKNALAPLVEVAHKKESAAALKAAAKEGIKAPKAIVNTSLIAGYRARGAGKLIDRSAKAALIEIYQNVTS